MFVSQPTYGNKFLLGSWAYFQISPKLISICPSQPRFDSEIIRVNLHRRGSPLTTTQHVSFSPRLSRSITGHSNVVAIGVWMQVKVISVKNLLYYPGFIG